MEYRYSPTPEKEEAKHSLNGSIKDIFELKRVTREQNEELYEYLGEVLYETGELLHLDGYALVIDAADMNHGILSYNTPASATIQFDEKLRMFIPHLTINFHFLEKIVKDNPSWKYFLAHVAAHESHHIRQFNIAPMLQVDEPLYNTEPDEEKALDLWNRNLSEFGAELFAFGYLGEKFKGSEDPLFKQHYSELEASIHGMQEAISARGFSYGVKDEEKLALIRKYNSMRSEPAF